MSLFTVMADDIRPPALSSTVSADHYVHQASTSTSAAQTALSLPSGHFYVSFQALTADCYIAFTNTAGAASVTTTTGWCVPAGTTFHCVIRSDVYAYVEHIASASGTLKWYVSSLVREKPLRGAGP